MLESKVFHNIETKPCSMKISIRRSLLNLSTKVSRLSHNSIDLSLSDNKNIFDYDNRFSKESISNKLIYIYPIFELLLN